MSIGPSETNLSEILMGVQLFIRENAFENIICEMVAILSRGEILAACPTWLVYKDVAFLTYDQDIIPKTPHNWPNDLQLLRQESQKCGKCPMGFD